MSLVFENAIGEFDIGAATLFDSPDFSVSDEGETRNRVPLETVTEYATHHERLQHPDHDDWICIPLHATDSAQLTGEYIGYTDHSVRGEIFIYQSEGERETVAIDDAAQSPLAARLQFWHSDYVPDTYPSYYTSPIQASEKARNPITDKSSDAFFDDLLGFIEGERNAQRETSREQAQRQSPAAIYRDGGDAIPNLSGLGKVSDGMYRFRLNHESSSRSSGSSSKAVSIPRRYGVCEDNEVLLFPPEKASAPEAFPITAIITDVTGENLYLEPIWDRAEKRSQAERFLDKNTQSGYGLVSLLNPVPLDREREAVERVRSNDRFRGVLTGRKQLTFGNSAAAQSNVHDEELNQEQQIAVEHALLADDFFCIHGPPGTGKTRALVEIVRRLSQAGRSVLVCADSNQAVDNLVVGSSIPDGPDERSLHAYAQHGEDEFSLARSNSYRSRSPIVQDQYGSQNEGKADVVGSTNSSAANIQREFDVAVIDEATQATCTATSIPISKAGKVILAGDHKQLPPFSSTESPPDSAFGMSMFEHLYADGGVYEGVGVQLRTQYRMHNQITYFPNRRFYDRLLRNGRTIESLPDQPALAGYDIGGTETQVDTSMANPTEARLIAHLTAELVSGDADLSPSQIGIITPYRAQVDEISDQIRQYTDIGGGVVIDTVDSFQGSEKRAVLISLVRSNPEGDIGFMGRPMDGPRRLNVALTRSERFCGIVGNWETLTASIDDEKCTGLYRDLHSHLDDTGRLRHVEPELIPS